MSVILRGMEEAVLRLSSVVLEANDEIIFLILFGLNAVYIAPDPNALSIDHRE